MAEGFGFNVFWFLVFGFFIKMLAFCSIRAFLESGPVSFYLEVRTLLHSFVSSNMRDKQKYFLDFPVSDISLPQI